MSNLETYTDAKIFIKDLMEYLISESSNERTVLFRGHSNASYELTPTLYRSIGDNIQDYNKILNLVHSEVLAEAKFKQMIKIMIEGCLNTNKLNSKEYRIDNLVEIIFISLIEMRFQTEFLKIANRGNLPLSHLNHIILPSRLTDPIEYLWHDLSTPPNKYQSKYCEKHIVKFLKNINTLIGYSCENFICDAIQKDDYGFLDTSAFSMRALSRHHGVPSRLLDWSINPFVAAFFAAIESNDNVNGEPPCHISVEILSIPKIEDQTENYNFDNAIIVHQDFLQHGLEYLIKQEGVLIELKHMDEYYYHYGKWPNLYEYLNKYEEKTTSSNKINYSLKQFQLVQSEVKKLRVLLNNMGYSLQRLMPSYDNAAKSVRQHMASVDWPKKG